MDVHEHPELNIPGFGWASKLLKHDGKNVVVHEGAALDTLPEFPSEYPVDYLLKFLNENKSILSLEGFDELSFKTKFNNAIVTAMKHYFSGTLAKQYDEIIQTQLSNGRKLYWNFMIIKPNCSFKLHAHPNIEVIFVVNGSIHEHRYAVSFF